VTDTRKSTEHRATDAGNGEGPAQETNEHSAGAQPAEPAHGSQPSEEELRAAYEAELGRISSFELTLQTVVSLLNIGGRRLGLTSGSEEHRDLEQVRDAIDGVRALMPVLERRMPAAELRPLRDALAQLQMAYAREAAAPPMHATAQPASGGPAPQADGPAAQEGEEKSASEASEANRQQRGPGPAEASGRLWVPGR
jgi:hypothetical protein